jgi:hypothetical protein
MPLLGAAGPGIYACGLLEPDQYATPQVAGALATGTYVTTGTTYQLFGPRSEAAFRAAGIHEPTLIFTSGLLVMRFVIDQSGAYVTSFSLHGTQQSGCALLAGKH